MRKRILIVFLLLVTLAACGQNALTWQEQYDLGVRYLSEGNYEEAIIAFTAAIEIDPKRAEAYVGRGGAYVLSGETEENLTAAKADYETAIELDSSIVDAYLALADIYLQQGDTEAAIAILERGYQATGDESLNSRRQELGLSGNEEVIWTDEVFEGLIRDRLGIPTGPVYVHDLDGITSLHIFGDVLADGEDAQDWGYRYVVQTEGAPGRLVAYYGIGETEYTTKGGITNVDALRYFRNLTEVQIVANRITDISVLNQLDNLERANFWGNEIADLSPLEQLPRRDPIMEEQFVEIGDTLSGSFQPG